MFFLLAVSAVITYIIAAIMEMIANSKLIMYSIKEQVTDIMPALLLSAVMGIVVFLFGQLPINQVIKILFQILIGVSVYVGSSMLFRTKSFVYIIRTLKQHNR